MSLANIENKPTVDKMENIMAGSMSNGQCALLGFAFVWNIGMTSLFFGKEVKQCWNS